LHTKMRMKKEKIITSFVVVLVAVCVVIFSVTFVRADLYDPGDTGTAVSVSPVSVQVFASASSSLISTSTISTVQNSVDDPSRLIIPALGINAHVQYVGVNTKGNIGTPNNFTDVAWYSLGVVPGQAGTAIIDGHVDNGLGLDGVFKHLSSIQVGDEVDVVDKSGARTSFIVVNVQAYDYQNVPASALFGTGSASSSLKLITCDGAWVQGGDTYNERLIVTADMTGNT